MPFCPGLWGWSQINHFLLFSHRSPCRWGLAPVGGPAHQAFSSGLSPSSYSHSGFFHHSSTALISLPLHSPAWPTWADAQPGCLAGLQPRPQPLIFTTHTYYSYIDISSFSVWLSAVTILFSLNSPPPFLQQYRHLHPTGRRVGIPGLLHLPAGPGS